MSSGRPWLYLYDYRCKILELSNTARLKAELVSMLCQADLTHSKIMDTLSQKFSVEHIDKILSEVLKMSSTFVNFS